MVLMAWKHSKALMVALLLLLTFGTSCRVKSWVLEEPALDTLDEFTAESVYPIGRSHAQEWQATAYLARVFVSFPDGDIDDEPAKISYEFATELQGNRQGYAWVDVYPKEGTAHVEAGPVAWTERPASPLAWESAVVHSLDALREAEAAGGKAYRESHSGVGVGVSGEWSGDGEMVWTVRYLESPGPAGFWFAIHAQTGEVLYPR
jgi:hypothetical protein